MSIEVLIKDRSWVTLNMLNFVAWYLNGYPQLSDTGIKMWDGSFWKQVLFNGHQSFECFDGPFGYLKAYPLTCKAIKYSLD